MVAKRKARSSTTLDFVAPFSLKMCENRLESKHERRRPDAPLLDSLASKMEVYIDHTGRETRTFNVSRGSAVVKGRLDRLSDESTWVSATAHIDWISHGLRLLIVPVFLLIGALIAFIAAGITGLVSPELSNFMGTALGFCVNHPLLVCGITLLYWVWRAYVNRNDLAHEVERALTDQITDVPDLGVLDDAVMVGDDGELVPAPPIKEKRHERKTTP